MGLTSEERKRVGRAIWGYSGKEQKPLATDASIGYHRLRAVLGPDSTEAPTVDELLALAEASGVPTRFVLEGFTPLQADDELGPIREQIATLQAAIRELVSPTLRPEDAGAPAYPPGLARRFRDAQRILEGREPGRSPGAAGRS